MGSMLGPTGQNSELGNQPNTAALRFRIQQNALDYAANGIEQRNRMLALNDLFRITDNYRVGELSLRLMLRVGQKQYDLIIVSEVPQSAHTIVRSSGKSEGGMPEVVRDQQGVLLGVCDVVQRKEGVIPSLVSLKRFKERHDLPGKVLQAFDSIRPVGFVIREGEMCGLLAPAMLQLDSPGHLIEAASQIVDGIEHDARQIIRKRGVKADNMSIFPSLTIAFDDVGVRRVYCEGRDLGFEIRYMVICATQNALSATEDVDHG